MTKNNIYQTLSDLIGFEGPAGGRPELEEVISGLITKFEPINLVNAGNRSQQTVGFECLLAHKDGLNFYAIKEKIQLLGIPGIDVFKILDIASMLVHFESIRKFSNNLDNMLTSNLFFTLNITKDIITSGHELNRKLMDMAGCLPVPKIYLELHEKIGFKDRTAANEHFLLSKMDYILDDLYAEAPPGHYMEYLQTERAIGLKYDHERFWDEYAQVMKGHDNNLKKHLEEMFTFNSKMVIIEGVRDASHLDFIFQDEGVVRGRSIYIQGEFAKADEKFLDTLANDPHSFAYILRKSPKETNTNLAEDLQIPDTYRKWVTGYCKYMDLKKLMDKGKPVRVELPGVFIPLYTDRLEKKVKEKKADREIGEEERKPVDIEDLAAQNECVLIEGQAGSGKTTLLKHMAYYIINNNYGRGLDEHLPVLIFLKDLQNIEKEKEEMVTDAALVERFLENYKISGATTAEQFLSKYFKCLGHGLDIEKVKEYCRAGKALFLFDGLDELDHRVRETVVNSLADFRSHYEGCRMVFSGRPHGIDTAVINRFGDLHVKINALNMDQVEGFIRKWFGFIFSGGAGLGVKTANEMMGEIRSHRSINELIDNPLMLTAICILYYDARELPDQRVELYKKFVDNLIHKRFDGPEEVLDFLMEMAFKVHVSKKRGFDRTLALELMGQVYARKSDETEEEYEKRNKRKFDEIEQNCGLLKLENGQYEFWHLAFQEFLGARYIASKKHDYINEIAPYWEDGWYREFVELFIGFLSIDTKGWANNIVLDALKKDDKSPFKRWRLAAGSLLDMHKSTREDGAIEKARERLTSIFEKKEAPKVKADAGEILGWLGDTRNLEEFVEIPGGKYNLEEIGDVDIETFKIGMYPVTNSWYEKFVKADGYKKEEYWSPNGWKWLGKNNYECPLYWHERQWRCPNSPVVSVSWYEADAFCRWLAITREDGNNYRLPTEQEWQAAAAGKDGRKYPWGEWDEGRCNNEDAGIEKTSPVGIFPKGETPKTCLVDMCGNVREWTCTDYKSNKVRTDFVSGKLGPVLKGSAWWNSKEVSGCAARDRDFPVNGFLNRGFRCART